MINKKGLSAIIATLILVVMTLVLVGIIWGVVSNLLEKKTGATEACFGIFEKVNLNSEYTCYTSDEFWFSINIEDIDVDEVLVGISSEESSSTFRISKTPSQISHLSMYSDGSSNIVLPEKNAGLTYVFDLVGAGYSGPPNSISIAPVIKGVQCGVSDSTEEIGRCSA